MRRIRRFHTTLILHRDNARPHFGKKINAEKKLIY